MDFVPAGYYEQEDEEEFDFGDSSAEVPYQDTPAGIEVCSSAKLAHGTSAGQLELEAEKEEAEDAGQFEDACTSSPTPSGHGGEGVSSSDFPSVSPISSVSWNGGHDPNRTHSPVTFNISTSRQESEESMLSCGGTAAAGDVSKPGGAFERARGGAVDDDDDGGRDVSCDPAMSRQLKALEVGEDMKVAVSRGNVELVSKMLDQGLDPDLPLSSGWPPLLHACDCCQETMIRLLLDRNADPNTGKDLLTPLIVLCMHKPHHLQPRILGCARLLVNKGAKVNARDRHHMTALLYTCQTGQADVAELLVSAKADVNVKDVRGWAPLTYAASIGHTSLLRLLVKSGADPKTTCNQHETPSSVAYGNGHIAAADWLDSVVTAGASGATFDLPLLGGKKEGSTEVVTNHTSSSDTPILGSGNASTGGVMGDLEMFLLGQQLGDMIPLFQQHKVEFGQMLSLTDSDLQLMGVAKVGCRKKILNGVLEVHKREWPMPENPLPFGRPISSAELTVILSNLSCHAHYLQGTAHFLLTHVQADSDLLGPHLELLEARKLTEKLAETVGVVKELQDTVLELQDKARKDLPAEALSATTNKGHGGHLVARTQQRNKLVVAALGVGVIAMVTLGIRHILTHHN